MERPYVWMEPFAWLRVRFPLLFIAWLPLYGPIGLPTGVYFLVIRDKESGILRQQVIVRE